MEEGHVCNSWLHPNLTNLETKVTRDDSNGNGLVLFLHFFFSAFQLISFLHTQQLSLVRSQCSGSNFVSHMI